MKSCRLCRTLLPPRRRKAYCSLCEKVIADAKKVGKKRCSKCDGRSGQYVRAGCCGERWVRCKACKGEGFV